jgi:hypothetical protein
LAKKLFRLEKCLNKNCAKKFAQRLCFSEKLLIKSFLHFFLQTNLYVYIFCSKENFVKKQNCSKENFVQNIFVQKKSTCKWEDVVVCRNLIFSVWYDWNVSLNFVVCYVITHYICIILVDITKVLHDLQVVLTHLYINTNSL